MFHVIYFSADKLVCLANTGAEMLSVSALSSQVERKVWLFIMNKFADALTYSVPFIYDSIQMKGVPAGPLEINVPGSKSITNRALLLATLAEGVSTLRGVLFPTIPDIF